MNSAITTMFILCSVVVAVVLVVGTATEDELATTKSENRVVDVGVVNRKNLTAKKKCYMKITKRIGRKLGVSKHNVTQSSVTKSNETSNVIENQIDGGSNLPIERGFATTKKENVEKKLTEDQNSLDVGQNLAVDADLESLFGRNLPVYKKKKPIKNNLTADGSARENLDVGQVVEVDVGSNSVDGKSLNESIDENLSLNGSVRTHQDLDVGQMLDVDVGPNSTTGASLNTTTGRKLDVDRHSDVNQNLDEDQNLDKANSVEGQFPFSSKQEASGRKLLHSEERPNQDLDNSVGDDDVSFGHGGFQEKTTSNEELVLNLGHHGQVTKPPSLQKDHRSKIDVPDSKPVRKLLAEPASGKKKTSINATAGEDVMSDDFLFDGRQNDNASSTNNPLTSTLKPTDVPSINVFSPDTDDSNELAEFHISAHQYNKETEVCCSGTVYPRPDTYSYTSCCGGHQYTINKQVCCGNVPYVRNESYVCCGSKYHSPRDSMCCYHPYSGEANLVPISPGLAQHVLCCGIRVYDTRTHICCTMEISEAGPVRPGSNQFSDRVSRFIIYERIYKNSGCCKGKVFNADSGMCQDVQLATRSLWTRLKPEVSRAVGICGRESYDTKHFWCCSGWEYKNMSGPIRYRVSSTPCCGLYSYDEEKHVCCGGVKYSQNQFGSLLCCGNNSVYDVHSQACCDYSYNVVPSRSLKNDGDMCCGEKNLPFFSHKQACCANTIIDVPQFGIGEYHCCVNPYNSSQVTLYLKGQEICCLGFRFELTTEQTHCCGQVAYSPDFELCCDGTLHKKLSEFDACCAGKPYNAHSEVCCGRDAWSVMKRVPKKRDCCINNFGLSEIGNCTCDVPVPVTYPRLARSNACCGLELFDSRNNRCCNSTITDPSSQLCCRVRDVDTGELVEYPVDKRTPNSICCGNVSYNPESQLCCKDNVAAWKGLDDVSCCGDKAFNKETQVCCGDAVADKGFLGTKCCGRRPYAPAIEMCCNKTGDIFAFRDARKFMACCYDG